MCPLCVCNEIVTESCHLCLCWILSLQARALQEDKYRQMEWECQNLPRRRWASKCFSMVTGQCSKGSSDEPYQFHPSNCSERLYRYDLMIQISIIYRQIMSMQILLLREHWKQQSDQDAITRAQSPMRQLPQHAQTKVTLFDSHTSNSTSHYMAV